MKRFWRDTRVETAAGGCRVYLDRRPVTTPAKRPLLLPSLPLAEAVAAEWRCQVEKVEPSHMPLTQLCCTTIDLTVDRAAEIRRDLAAYGGTDLLCYWASAPPSLVERQQQGWQPLLDWAAENLRAPLRTTTGVMTVSQSPESLAALSRAVEGYGDFHLTALAELVRTTGSLVLGLAVAAGRLTADEAFDLAELDATHQMEQWGKDSLAMKRRAAMRTDMNHAERLLSLLRAN